MTVNHDVVGSSPTAGVSHNEKKEEYCASFSLESCPRGRRSMIGNHVDGEHCLKGSNPLLSVIYFWSVGQAVKTPPFHGGNTGSNPVRIIVLKKWGFSSAGRASALQAEGQRFEPVNPHSVPWCRG